MQHEHYTHTAPDIPSSTFICPSFSPYQQATFASGVPESSSDTAFAAYKYAAHYYLNFMQKSQRSFPRPSVMLLSQISFGCRPV